jgi:DNA-binding PadR family transcriptional regulator
MLVLGVIRMHQPIHGYDVRKELVAWHVEEWASVLRGSIYSALKTLAKEGMVRTAGAEQVGGRPERTLYTITPKGEAELSKLLHDTLWEWRMPIDPLLPAIALMPFLKRGELIAGRGPRREDQGEAHERVAPRERPRRRGHAGPRRGDGAPHHGPRQRGAPVGKGIPRPPPKRRIRHGRQGPATREEGNRSAAPKAPPPRVGRRGSSGACRGRRA